MAGEICETPTLPVNELLKKFIEACKVGKYEDLKDKNERIEALKNDMKNKYTSSELNEMKIYLFNDFASDPLENTRGDKFKFLCVILNLLKDKVSYSKDYKELVDYLGKIDADGFNADFKEEEFDEMVDKLSISELYQALNGGNYRVNGRIVRRLIKKIKEKEKNKKEEKSSKLTDRLSSALKASPEGIIRMLLEVIEEQKQMLQKIDTDNNERFQRMMDEFNEIKRLVNLNR